ncbi:AMP-binding protein [Rhodoferax sp. 4810]|uniref:AMP-binding protein n=1 Tax=Thiospirillum jenense TaxID=1653858 RepID=A0A839HE58_9GAMM|nr:AMP-binding protein [Thiospirillum jenense]MBB1075125.1 AMP-binding protein [Rhodoferax jenense]MBB1126774.1 AMP-binding protein [Thiospirillum jenense]
MSQSSLPTDSDLTAEFSAQIAPESLTAGALYYPPRPFHYQTTDTLFTALIKARQQFGCVHDQWEDMQPKQYCYADLIQLSLVLGRLITKHSAAGEHIGILMPNMTVTMGLLIGTSAFGRIPCMLNYTAGSDGIQHACQVAQIKTVITSRAFLNKADLTETIGAVRQVQFIYLESLRKQFSLFDKLWLMLFARWRPKSAVPIQNSEAPAVVLFTSGSEGKPKGVVLSHRALLTNVAQIMAALSIDRRDSVFNCLPIFHSFGLTAGTLLPLVSGAKLMLYTSPLHFKLIPEFIRTKRSTVLFGTSTFLLRYAQNGSRAHFESLRYVVAGAEKLAAPVRHLWSEHFGIDILEGYGATETAPVLAVNTPTANRIGSVGQLLPGIAAQVIPVPEIHSGGELHVCGDNLMLGYYHYTAPAQLEPPASIAGLGWYNTGDVVMIDSDGFIHITGRLKRFAKVAGEMVSLELIESVARAISTDALHAAICIADVGRGEAIILCTTDAALTREQLVTAVRNQGYPEIVLPRRIKVLETLPLLGTGKIDYLSLRALEMT